MQNTTLKNEMFVFQRHRINNVPMETYLGLHCICQEPLVESKMFAALKKLLILKYTLLCTRRNFLITFYLHFGFSSQKGFFLLLLTNLYEYIHNSFFDMRGLLCNQSYLFYNYSDTTVCTFIFCALFIIINIYFVEESKRTKKSAK